MNYDFLLAIDDAFDLYDKPNFGHHLSAHCTTIQLQLVPNSAQIILLVLAVSAQDKRSTIFHIRAVQYQSLSFPAFFTFDKWFKLLNHYPYIT